MATVKSLINEILFEQVSRTTKIFYNIDTVFLAELNCL